MKGKNKENVERSLGIQALFRVRGLMAINVECEFRDQGSISRVYQITNADLWQVG